MGTSGSRRLFEGLYASELAELAPLARIPAELRLNEFRQRDNIGGHVVELPKLVMGGFVCVQIESFAFRPVHRCGLRRFPTFLQETSHPLHDFANIPFLFLVLAERNDARVKAALL